MNYPPEKLHDATPAEINDDLMVLHAPAALYGAQVSQKAIVTVAHPSQPQPLNRLQGRIDSTRSKSAKDGPISIDQSCGCVLAANEAVQ
jgi:hypothetical protein